MSVFLHYHYSHQHLVSPTVTTIINITQPAIAYGGNTSKRGDNNAMLISIRTSSASSPPILHWKCRLPETDMTGGLLVSPCGYYIVGGGSSGSCYVWSSIGGELLRSVKAHYRSCKCLAWSDCGRYVVTGGDDGMIHLFSLMELVDITTRKSKRSVAPMHTFSVFHFPVTSLIQLPSGRMAAAAQDGQVIVIELFSKLVLMNIQFPHGIQCMTHYDGRLYLGSVQGTIYSVDMNAYAMYQTEKQGATFAKRRRQDQSSGGVRTIEETIFGPKGVVSSSSTTPTDEINNNSSIVYQTDWVGHDHPVSAIALLTQADQKMMISGDEMGQLRIWDLDSRTCLNVLQPWSQGSVMGSTNRSSVSTSTADSSKTASAHPITSINIIPQPTDSVRSTMFRTAVSAAVGSSGKNVTSISTLVTPLQKFVSAESSEGGNTTTTSTTTVRVPFMKPNRSEESMKYWEAKPIYRKRPRIGRRKEASKTDNNKEEEQTNDASNNNQVAEMNARIKELEEQLKTKDSEIARWENVNNKLMAKLKTK